MNTYGIDVAKWQGVIDWDKVKNTDKKFAILKITNKSNNLEPAFEKNYTGATKAGMEVGVYRYVYATSEEAAKKEANAIVAALKNKKLTLGVWMDMEDASIKGIGKEKLTSIIETETKILNAAGYKVGIYCNKNWYEKVLDSTYLKERFPFWIARYSSNDTGKVPTSLSPSKYADAWQYSSKGKVSGITGNVDLDMTFGSLSDKMKYTGEQVKKQEYYKKYTGSATAIDTVLKSIGADKDYDQRYFDYRKRIPIAAKNGFDTPYRGSSTQNSGIVKLAKAGKLKKV